MGSILGERLALLKTFQNYQPFTEKRLQGVKHVILEILAELMPIPKFNVSTMCFKKFNVSTMYLGTVHNLPGPGYSLLAAIYFMNHP